VDNDCTPDRDKIIQLNETAVRNYLGQIVRSAVKQTLNYMLDVEADRLCNAEKYQRNEARTDTRADHYHRKLQTQAGEVTLNVPKLRRQTFETAIIARYRRREASVEEALIRRRVAPRCEFRSR
jgi:putative transposase